MSDWEDRMEKERHLFDECYKHVDLVDVEDYDCINGLPTYNDIKIDLICKHCGKIEKTIPGTLCCNKVMIRPIKLDYKEYRELLELNGKLHHDDHTVYDMRKTSDYGVESINNWIKSYDENKKLILHSMNRKELISDNLVNERKNLVCSPDSFLNRILDYNESILMN